MRKKVEIRNFEFHVKKFVKMKGVMYLLVKCKQKFTNFSFWGAKIQIIFKIGIFGIFCKIFRQNERSSVLYCF